MLMLQAKDTLTLKQMLLPVYLNISLSHVLHQVGFYHDFFHAAMIYSCTVPISE